MNYIIFKYINQIMAMWEKQKMFMSSYLCQAFVEAVERYENLIQISVKDNIRDKDPVPFRTASENLKLKSFSMLTAGYNRMSYIEVVALRIIVHGNYTFILASETVPVYDTNKYLCLIVISPDSSQTITQQWHRDAALNMNLVVKEPCLQTELSNDMQICLVRLQNIKIKEGKRWKEKVEQIKEKGNQAFKQKSFLLAFIYYEYALACCQDFKDSKTRAILYSNSSACLYEMRLYDTSIKYASMAIRTDNDYLKGYIRKILSLMQKKQFNDIPNLLVGLQSKANAETVSTYNRRYTVYLCNSIGMYNWKDIFQQPKKQTYFGQFFSKKISTRLEGTRYVYYANAPIKKYELLILNKPSIYVISNSPQPQDIYPDFDQVQQYTALQKSFYFAIKNLPCQCHPEGGVDNHNTHAIEKQQLKRKMKRCICLEKDLERMEKPTTKKTGVWTEMFNFSHHCQPNCSLIHLRTVMCLSAVKNIPKGEILTLDYVGDVPPTCRKGLLMNNFGISCKCKICEWKQWPKDITNTQQIIKTINSLDSIKMLKQIFWQLISQKNKFEPTYTYKDILEKYTEIVEKETHWEDLANLFRLLRSEKNETHISIERAMLSKGMSQFLKLPIDQSRQLIDLII